jgi:hypothetical protein
MMFSRNPKLRSIQFGILLIVMPLFISSCQTIREGEQESIPTSNGSAEVAGTPFPTFPPFQPTPAHGVRVGGALPVQRSTFFATSGLCAACHSNLVDAEGNNVSNDDLWRSTMMANSSRDPYWKAAVRAEVMVFPEFREVIEDKCAVCHFPMAWFLAEQAGEQVKILDDSFLDPSHKYHPFAVDGVSCTLCHQVEDDNLGHPDSFSGGFLVDDVTPIGRRLAYGPYLIPPGQANIMLAGSGFEPVFADHTQQSELCATCHNLTTDTLDPSGVSIGEFHEQMVYLEWLHSSFIQTHSCQDCHMPVAEGSVRISNTGSPPRTPFYQHYFVGGNAYMAQLLDVFGEELGVTASTEHFQATQERALDQLQNRTLGIEFESLQVENGKLVADIRMQNHAGHKFPSGYPSRRAWLHFQVQDGSGDVIFESGRVNGDGSIHGNDNDRDPGLYEPHYQVIDRPDQVQIYEVIFLDVHGNITTGLLSAYEYLKDNRFIPSGFDKHTAFPEVAVYGAAFEDQDFLGGSDRLSYQVDVGERQGPFTVSVRVLYQAIAYRWMENLRAFDAPEIEAMSAYYDALPDIPVVVAEIIQRVGE